MGLVVGALVAAAVALPCALKESPGVPHAIRHVVVVVQENRSFDNLFHGYPGADTADSGLIHTGDRVTLQPVSLKADFDLSHGFSDFVRAYDGGKMDRFDLSHAGAPPQRRRSIMRIHFPQYAYVPTSEIVPYWAMARQYALFDHMFQSNLDQSFAAHLYLIAGQAGSSVNVPSGRPWGCDAMRNVTVRTITHERKLGPRIFPCFSFRTIADEMEDRGLSWRYYAPRVDSSNTWRRFLQARRRHRLKRGDPKPEFGQLWSSFDAIAQVRYGTSWSRSVRSPETSFFSDVRENRLAALSWIIPDLKNSDHSSSLSDTGPDWVSSIVNAIGTTKYWYDTVILIVWDDSGGWYDHVPPPQLDYDGLGDRVPLLLISAYSRPGVVIHGQTEFGSILRLIEDTFHLQRLADSDRRASTLYDAFQSSGWARPFVPVASRHSASYFESQPPSHVEPDDL